MHPLNILYITNLSTNIAAGLNWSVPATVNAQSKIDNVLWVNLTNTEMPHWKKIKAFHNIDEYGNISIDKLPYPFNKPDVVVFEGFYHPKDPKFAKELQLKNIPYIIVPRCSLTDQAQNKGYIKKVKKRIANFLIFKRYAKRATAIQYLTEQEFLDSGTSWNNKKIIIPNGFTTPLIIKDKFSEDSIKAVFIGRLDLFQKGLDVLIEGCYNIRDRLKQEQFTLDIYGPKRYDYNIIADKIKKHNMSDIIKLKDEISGPEKEKVLVNSDLFVLTSRFEGHPMGLLEAIAYGLPCLVSPGSNMSKEIYESNAGWVCQPNAYSISKSILTILENKQDLSIKGKNARQLSLLYNWDKIALDFHNEVIRLLN